MLWSRIIVESNTAYDQCSDSNNLKLQRSRSAASSLRRRFGKISSRQESYRADPKLLQRFGRLFSPPDAALDHFWMPIACPAEFAPEPVEPTSLENTNLSAGVVGIAFFSVPGIEPIVCARTDSQ